MSTRTRLVLGLGVSCAVAGAAVVPYLAALQPEVANAGVPLWAMAVASGVQTGLLCTLLAWLGLMAGDAVGLGAPGLTRWMEGLGRPPWPALVRAAGLGIGLGVLVGVVDWGLLLPLLPEAKGPIEAPGGLVALGASLYGSIVEEVMLRLFLLTVLAWLGTRVGLGRLAAPLALAGSALLFGVGHLPVAAALWPLTPLVVARVVGLNLALGITFGVAYLRQGLLFAMAMHLGVDLGLHVLLPLFS